MTTYAKEIDESYATQMSALAENFSLCCAAAALFYLDPESKKDGLRVEATSIMREFITNVKFGRDPEGILFYKYLSDLKSDDKVYYSVLYNKETTKAIRVDFCTKENDSTTRFASFLTKDTTKIVPSKLKNGSGKWVEQPMGTCSANLHKSSTDTKVTLKLKPIAKKATFNITDDDVTKLTTTGDGKTVKAKELPIETNGIFHFKSIGDFKDVSTHKRFATYNSDTLIFFIDVDKSVSESGQETIGVFFPDSDKPLEIKRTSDKTAPEVKWVDL